MRPIHSRFKARPLLLFWSAIGLAIATQYNACSKIAFEDASYEEKLMWAESIPSITINNGAPVTKDVKVNLTLDSRGAAGMLISNSVDCATGSWEPYNTSRDWNLGSLNQDAVVYAKFRTHDNYESICVSASILHDDTPPAIIIDSPVPALTRMNSVASAFHATDSGSGVDSLLCIYPGQTSPASCNGSYMDTVMADGGYRVQFLAKDVAGNFSAPVEQLFTVDMTPPSITLNSTPLATTSDTNAKFEFQGTDNLSGIHHYECKVDGAADFSNCVSGVQYQSLPYGSHAFSARAVDSAGNVSLPVSYLWTIGASSPTIEFTQVPAALNHDTTATFGFRGKEGDGTPLTLFECSFDGGTYSACSSPRGLSGIAEGEHTFSVRGISIYGGSTSPLSFTWKVDLTAPVIQITHGPDRLTNSNSANFAFSVMDNSGVASVMCSLNGGTAQSCAGLTISYDHLGGNAQHTFVVTATDGAGNTATSLPYLWEIDNTPPTVSIDSKPPALTASTQAAFQVSGTDLNGPVTFQCRIDNEATFNSCANPINYTSLADGTHTFRVQSRDAAGNLSAEATYSWVIQTAGPEITFTRTPNQVIKTTEAGVLSYEVTDTLATVTGATCKLDAMVLNCPLPTGTLTFPQLPAGTHTFILTATNSLGVSSTKSYEFTVQEPNCTTTPTQITIPTKMLFVVDQSSSNGSSSCTKISSSCTDPGKKMRAGSIQAFYDKFGSHTNFSWGFNTFAGTSSKALINVGGNTSSPKFSDAAAMQSAIITFKNTADSGSTPYIEALKLAKKAIETDPDLQATVNAPQYIVVFMSDGRPSSGTESDILTQVRSIKGLSLGRISFNTVYYGPQDATASGLVQRMASEGGGNFLNTQTNPTGLTFNIEDLINIPVTTCE